MESDYLLPDCVDRDGFLETVLEHFDRCLIS
jgi:hypothetical protein